MGASKVQIEKAKRFLLLISASALIAVGLSILPVQQNEVATSFEQTAAQIPVPVLRQTAGTILLSAKAAYAVDLESGKVLFAKNENEPLLPASTTKIATALVALNHYKFDQILTVGELDIDGKTMELTEGETISVRNLIYGLLVFSANDAAEVLARNYPGGRSNFVFAMNRLADSAELTTTHFVNPTGLDEYLHFSTAKDLTLLASHAVKNPTFAEIVATPKLSVASADGKTIHELTNVNELLGRVSGVLGVKTGWTINAGEALITLVERDGHKVIISVLGSTDRFGETEKLINWIQESYYWD